MRRKWLIGIDTTIINLEMKELQKYCHKTEPESELSPFILPENNVEITTMITKI
jgi:hypothetical protein